MNAAGAVILVILFLLIGAGVGWIVFTRVRAQRLGLPPPSLSSYLPFRRSSASYGVQPAPGGIQGWFNDQVRKFKNRNARTAAGAYEQSYGGSRGAGGRGRGGFGPLDPDEAWDSRVGNEADTYGPGGYYEEQELGLAPGHGVAGHTRLQESGHYGGGSSYDMNLAMDTNPGPYGSSHDEEEPRGRPRSRSPGASGGGSALNPFDDDAEPSNVSMRGVSPRPIDTAGVSAKHSTAAGAGAKEPQSGDSTGERRSIFREEV